MVERWREVADAIVALLKLDLDARYVVGVRMGSIYPPLRGPFVRFVSSKIGLDWSCPQHEAWLGLDEILARVPKTLPGPHPPISPWHEPQPVGFGTEPEHDGDSTTWGLFFDGEVWARYGDARGVLTYRDGATRWREKNGDPFFELRQSLARELFPGRVSEIDKGRPLGRDED